MLAGQAFYQLNYIYGRQITLLLLLLTNMFVMRKRNLREY